MCLRILSVVISTMANVCRVECSLHHKFDLSASKLSSYIFSSMLLWWFISEQEKQSKVHQMDQKSIPLLNMYFSYIICSFLSFSMCNEFSQIFQLCQFVMVCKS